MTNISEGKNQAARVFIAGLLPVIAFTLIEEYFGTWAGLFAGMAFGVGEIAFELYKYKKVQKITWVGNGLLLGLGSVSLISSEGIWFKLQPAIMEAVFAFMCWGSLLFKKNLLVALAEQQGQSFPELIKDKMNGMTFRIGLFFAIHAGLAVWAALYWSTTAWALLKGVGLTVSFILYMIFEGLLLRKTALKIQQDLQNSQQQNI